MFGNTTVKYIEVVEYVFDDEEGEHVTDDATPNFVTAIL